MITPNWTKLSLFVISSLFASGQSAHAAECRLRATDVHAWIQFETQPQPGDFENCLGYFHGKIRGFQVYFFRETASGRAAEVSGFKALKQDLFLKLLDLPKRAEMIFHEMNPSAQLRLSEYAKGVERGWKDSLNSEFFTFGIDRAKISFSPWDPILILLLQSFDQTKQTFELDVKEGMLEGDSSEMLSEFERVSLGEIAVPWEHSILGSANLKVAANKSTFIGRPSEGGEGSNNFVVSSGKGAREFAWLENDPHLPFKRPAFWTWVQLSKADGSGIQGGMVPGIPVFVVGANKSLAWGITNAYHDVSDAIVIDPKVTELKTSTVRPVVWIRVLGIKVPFFFKAFELTEQGFPVLPLEDKIPKGTKLVLRSSLFDLRGSEVEEFLNLGQAISVSEMDKLLARTQIPSFNFVFADVDGNAGYRAIGKVPKSGGHRVGAVTPRHWIRGDKDSLKPWSYLTPEEMPHRILRARERGHLVTANHHPFVSSKEPALVARATESFRGFRINEKLNELKGKEILLSSLSEITCDTQAVDARFFLPLLSAKLVPGQVSGVDLEYVKQMESEWREKGFRTDETCKYCGFYRKWFDKVRGGLSYRALYAALTSSDPKTVAIVGSRIRNALQEISSLGLMDRDWKATHFAVIPPLTGMGEQIRISAPGDRNSVNVSGGAWSETTPAEFQATFGPSVRFIVELSKPPRVIARVFDPDREEEISAWQKCDFQVQRGWGDPSPEELKSLRIDLVMNSK